MAAKKKMKTNATKKEKKPPIGPFGANCVKPKKKPRKIGK